jgi:hypothetical protein
MYMFHLFREDGGSTAFETHELSREDEVAGRAAQLLQDHSSCVRVTVWQADRQVIEWSRSAA